MMRKANSILAKASFGVSVLALVVASSAVSAQQAPPLVAALDTPQVNTTQVSRNLKTARADSTTPSNAQLFEMIKAMQAQQGALTEQARKAKAEAAQAKSELAATRQELENAKAKIAANSEDVQKAAETIKVATVGLRQSTAPGGRTVMGSQLSATAVTVETNPGWFAEASAGAVSVGDDGLGFVIDDPDGNDNASGLNGELESVSDGETGVEVVGTIGKRDGNGNELRARLAYLDFDGSGSCTVQGGADVCNLPFANINADIDPDDLDNPGDFARANVDIQKIVFDLEAGKTLALGQDLTLGFAGGARLASIDQDFDVFAAEVNAGGAIIDSASKNQSNELFGGGVRASSNMVWRRGNMTIGGGVGGSLLVMNRDYSIRETDDPATPGVAPSFDDLLNFDTDETIIVPVLDANAEVNFSFQAGGRPAYFTFGYKFESWIDAIRSSAGIDDTVEQAVTTHHGPYIKLGIALGGEGQ